MLMAMKLNASSFKMGELSKNPNDLAIKKMKKIAASLSAKVQGDDGTVFIDLRK
jgi:hypothetical protein